jgi:hypothetical protein
MPVYFLFCSLKGDTAEYVLTVGTPRCRNLMAPDDFKNLGLIFKGDAGDAQAQAQSQTQTQNGPSTKTRS